MDKIIIYWKLPMGYKIREIKREVDLYTAFDILRSRKQKHITSVERVDDKAIIKSHRIVCPHCGKETPAYSHCWNKHSSAFPKKSVAEITEWANIQPSLINEPDEEMKIQEHEDFSEEYICPKCGYSSNKSNECAELYIDYIDRKLFVKRAIKSLSEMVSLKWLNGSASITFPVYEQVVFDFESRNSYIEFLSDKEVVCAVPITDSETDFTEDTLIDLLSKNNILKRTIRRCFEQVAKFKMPFSTKELDIDKFVNFVRFKGFPKDFYDAIPFWKGTRVLDESFQEITRRLREPECAMVLLEKSSIPYCKSVKRLFVKRSGLFFYLRECEFLYNLLGDVNLFCSYLDKVFTFYFLSMMHYYEKPVKTFLKDYMLVLGKQRFAAKFSPSEDVIRYGIHYASLSVYVRKKEQEKWLNGVDVFDDFSNFSYIENNISVSFTDSGKKDMVVDKYRFKHLRTKQECVIAGDKMKNCLVYWDSFSNPVVIVYKGDKIVAAVEFDNHTWIQKKRGDGIVATADFTNGVLEQARKCKNESIEPNSDLYNAIKKWCKLNNIKFAPEKLDDMPF